MAIPATTTPERTRNSTGRGLVLVDDRVFLRQVQSLCDEIGIEIRVYNDAVDAVERSRTEWNPNFAIIDQLVTRSQLYGLARTIRSALNLTVFAVSHDHYHLPADADSAVRLLSRSEVLGELRKLGNNQSAK